MRIKATLAEARALGLRRAAQFGLVRARRSLNRLLFRRSHTRVTLTDAEWIEGLGGRPVESVVQDFVSGVADLEWYAAQEPATATERLRGDYPAHVASVLHEAEQAQRNVVMLFDQPVSVEGPSGRIDWQRDWLGDFRWSNEQPSDEIPIGRQPGADPRVAWELGRCSHVLTLAQGYALTNDDCLARTAFDHILSFISHNPAGRGVQWASTMDVAIRAANWMAAWQFLRRAPIARDFAQPILRSLVEHGRFIYGHLENEDGITSNHYLADLAGLASLGQLDTLWAEAAQWGDYWAAKLPGEISSQVLADGYGFEASVSYHRLSLELLAFPLVIPRLRQRLPGEALERLARMVEATVHYSSSRGLAPQFGDNDGGRLHVLHRRDPLDHGYLEIFQRLFDRAPRRDAPEGIWLFGAGESAPSHAPATISLLPDAGIAAIRDERAEIIFTCGPNGQHDRGGHAHNDKLSWVFFVDTAEVIVDPGTFGYTRDLPARQRFRSTGVHSTWQLENAEQNRFSFLSGFRLIPDARPLPMIKRQRGNRMTISSGHTGYERAPIRIRHCRRIIHQPGSPRWSVLDLLSPSRDEYVKPVSIVYTLPLAPGIAIEEVKGQDWRVRTPGGTFLSAETRCRGVEGEWNVEEGWISRTYGDRSPSVVLRFRGWVLPGRRRPAMLLTLKIHDR
jgi:hypothetical protein